MTRRKRAATATNMSDDAAVAQSGTTNPDITITYLTVDDRDTVRLLHEQLSEHDAYMRFFSPPPTHLDDLVAMLCQQDATHTALGAFAGDELVGVSNYVITGTATEATSAEFALVVAHDQQSHGVGTMLLRELVGVAYNHGVRRLTAEILAQNTLMLAVIGDLGWSEALHHNGPNVHLDLDLLPVPETSRRNGVCSTRTGGTGAVHAPRNQAAERGL